jgi:hypothetical protein
MPVTANDAPIYALTAQQLDTFWTFVDKRGPDECWLWAGLLHMGGKRNEETYGQYGLFVARAGGRGKHRAHRVSYFIAYGRLDSALMIDHLCRNPQCVNPRHLEQVTNRTNQLRGDAPAATNALVTHCVNGHLLAGENLWIEMVGEFPHRRCRTCRKASAVRHRSEKRAERRPIDVEEAARLRAIGQSWMKVGAAFGVSDVAVAKAMKKAGRTA